MVELAVEFTSALNPFPPPPKTEAPLAVALVKYPEAVDALPEAVLLYPNAEELSAEAVFNLPNADV